MSNGFRLDAQHVYVLCICRIRWQNFDRDWSCLVLRIGDAVILYNGPCQQCPNCIVYEFCIQAVDHLSALRIPRQQTVCWKYLLNMKLSDTHLFCSMCNQKLTQLHRTLKQTTFGITEQEGQSVWFSNNMKSSSN